MSNETLPRRFGETGCLSCLASTRSMYSSKGPCLASATHCPSTDLSTSLMKTALV